VGGTAKKHPNLHRTCPYVWEVEDPTSYSDGCVVDPSSDDEKLSVHHALNQVSVLQTIMTSNRAVDVNWRDFEVKNVSKRTGSYISSFVNEFRKELIWCLFTRECQNLAKQILDGFNLLI
jgi:hypothetical protein